MIEGILIAAVVVWLLYRFANGTRCPSCHKLAGMRKSGEARMEIVAMKEKKQREYRCRGCGHTESHGAGYALGAMFLFSGAGSDGFGGGDGGDGGAGCGGGGCGGA